MNLFFILISVPTVARALTESHTLMSSTSRESRGFRKLLLTKWQIKTQTDKPATSLTGTQTLCDATGVSVCVWTNHSCFVFLCTSCILITIKSDKQFNHKYSNRKNFILCWDFMFQRRQMWENGHMLSFISCLYVCLWFSYQVIQNWPNVACSSNKLTCSGWVGLLVIRLHEQLTSHKLNTPDGF